MAVRGSAKRQPDAYFELVHRFPLTVIRDDGHLDRAVEMIDELIDRTELSTGEQEYLDALSALVDRVEKETFPVKPIGGVAMLKHLMEAKGVNQTEVAQGAKIAESTVSEILAGKRRIGRDHVGKLARFFNVDRSVFIGDW